MPWKRRGDKGGLFVTRSQPRTRRAATAVVLAFLLAAAACGDDDDTTSAGGDEGSATTAAATETAAAESTAAAGDTTASTTGASETSAAAEEDYDPAGVLRVSSSFDIPGGVHLDPTKTVVNSDEAWQTLVYGTLVRPNAEGTFDPWMAESVEVVDPSTVGVTLREGLVFTDGEPYDAEAVRTGILRNLNVTEPAVLSGRHGLFPQLADITVVGPLELTFTLKTPVAGEFISVLAGRESAVPSPKAIADGADLDANPVGAGPYMLESYRPNELISLRKNPDFFAADEWKLGGIDFTHIAAGAATATALLAGQIDDVQLTSADSKAVEGNDQFEVLRSFTEFSFLTINFCSTQPPFDNELVRKAVQRGIDREALNQVWLQEAGQPAYGYWPQDHANFAEDLVETTQYDLDEAKRLMAESGATDVSIELYYPASPAYEPLGDLLQAQLGAIGINATLMPTPQIVDAFILPKKPGAMFVPGSRAGVDKVLKIFQPGQAQNLCDADRTEINEMAAQVAALPPDDPEAVELWKDIDREIAEHAYVVFLVQSPNFTVLNRDRVGGELFVSPTRSPASFQSYENLYIKA
jgi:peptide/nickel transport system substrate-binding protein